MLTNDQALICAYSVFQSHYKANVINDQRVADEHWQRNPQARALWLGVVHSVLANAATFIMETEQGLAKKPIGVADAIKRAADPSRIVQAMKAREAAQGSGAGPFGPAGKPKKPYPAPGTLMTPSAAAADLAPGLAIGRCTEQPETPADDFHGRSERETDIEQPGDNASEPAGDA